MRVLLRGRRPANAGRNRRMVILALDRINPTALVEAENLHRLRVIVVIGIRECSKRLV